MREGRTDVAVGFYEQSLALDPSLVNNHLSLAAAYLDKGDDEQALPHLAQYVAAKPEHFIVRAHYAELLLLRSEKITRPSPNMIALTPTSRNARRFGQTGTRSLPQPFNGNRGTTRRRLRRTAHRGIGLYLLACQSEQARPDDESFSTESLLLQGGGGIDAGRGDNGPSKPARVGICSRSGRSLAQRSAGPRVNLRASGPRCCAV